ncbi:hypothetical protein LOD99_797 [Oopsacas minuta]|uniref:Uncharacterized protein n=1 Tax=Oopsacas minuta TaxID=111878 RepID=A0AAV7K2B7_9METZ|nr:hypothetical protein LOD99_797 [Oopsacas minuta]
MYFSQFLSSLDEVRITDDKLFSLTFESEFNVAILGHPDYIGDLKEDYIKASTNEKIEKGMMAWEKISFETFDFTKGQSSNNLFQPNG